MKKIKIALLLAVSTICIQSSLLAQKSKIHGIEIEVGQFQGVNSNGDSTYSYTAKIHLQDTIDVYKVHIQVGNSFMADNIYKDTCQIYLAPGETNPASITRNGNLLTVNLGAIVPSFFFWEIVTENLNNVKYSPYRKQL